MHGPTMGDGYLRKSVEDARTHAQLLERHLSVQSFPIALLSCALLTSILSIFLRRVKFNKGCQSRCKIFALRCILASGFVSRPLQTIGIRFCHLDHFLPLRGLISVCDPNIEMGTFSGEFFSTPFLSLKIYIIAEKS